MINIKIILLVPLILLILLVLPRLRSQAAARLLLIGISLLGILFVLFPSITNQLAHFVGVGRGADLVTYLFIIFFFLFGVLLYSKIRKITENQTELVRKIAIQQAKKMDNK
jgi:hypothetical protein